MTESYNPNSAIAIGDSWWERSASPFHSNRFLFVTVYGDPFGTDYATVSNCVCPAWCF